MKRAVNPKAKKRVSRVFSISMIPIIVGFLISYFFLPEFIGENETEQFDIVPNKMLMVLFFLMSGLFIYLQVKYKVIFENKFNFLPLNVLLSALLLPVLAGLISWALLFSVYSLSNFGFANKIENISGKIYKKDVYEVSKGPNKYFIYFNEIQRFKLRVNKRKHDSYGIGDDISIEALKGRHTGYYLTSKSERE